MEHCIFCKIVNGDLPGMKIYEDEHTCVFLDIADDVNGHMAAVPKKHVNNIPDCDTKTLGHLMSAVKLIANHCVDNCGFDGVNLLNASGESAGQSVPHFHIHIIPRKDKDGIEAWPAFEGSTKSREEMYELLRVKGTQDVIRRRSLQNEGKPQL